MIFIIRMDSFPVPGSLSLSHYGFIVVHVCACVSLLALWMGIVKGTSTALGIKKQEKETWRKGARTTNGTKWASFLTASLDDNRGRGSTTQPHLSFLIAVALMRKGNEPIGDIPVIFQHWEHHCEVLGERTSPELHCTGSRHRGLSPDWLLPSLLAKSVCLSTSSPPLLRPFLPTCQLAFPVPGLQGWRVSARPSLPPHLCTLCAQVTSKTRKGRGRKGPQTSGRRCQSFPQC